MSFQVPVLDSLCYSNVYKCIENSKVYLVAQFFQAAPVVPLIPVRCFGRLSLKRRHGAREDKILDQINKTVSLILSMERRTINYLRIVEHRILTVKP